MASFFFSAILFIIWAIAIIGAYFMLDISHAALIANGSSGIFYALILIVIYGIYKWIMYMINPKKIRFTFWHLVGFFVLHILVLSFVYNMYIFQGGTPTTFGGTTPSSLVLFFHIISLLVYPIFLVFLWRAIGYAILEHVSLGWRDLKKRLRIPIETAIGLGIFATALLILGAISLYTLEGLAVITIILTLASFRGWIATYHDIRKSSIEFERTSVKSLFDTRLITAEIAYIMWSFVAIVSLINAIRPMPIGWDDLGVYMNFPKLMALSGEYLLGAGMYSWQLVTGTGFLFSNNAALAFFVNQIGGFLATITIISAFSLFFDNGKKQRISLPMLLGIVYYLMPMTIFQQAKDQKLDPALMFVSITAVLALWYGVRAIYHTHEASKHRDTNLGYALIAIAGILVGIAFGIKFTTLMLIITGIGFLSYRALGFFGFTGWIGIFISIFTALDFWKKLFIWMPDNTTPIVIGSGIIGISCLAVGIVLHQKYIKKGIVSIIIFSFFIAIGVSPWLIKNANESDFFVTESIDGLLNGSGGLFVPDLTKLYSSEELREKQALITSMSEVGKSGQVLNEDFSRYFGQEVGINNYMKLPFNLTIQANQGNEFTDITYIFLALVPTMLLFLKPRKGREWIYLGTLAILITLGAIIAISVVLSKVGVVLPNADITTLFAAITLPGGYLVMIAFVLLFAALVTWCLDREDQDSERAQNMIFLVLLYGLIFWISSFGIVWYGVLIYFFMLAMIGFGALRFVSIDEEIFDKKSHAFEKREFREDVKTGLTGVFFIIIILYWIFGAFPHSWNNLTSAGYNEYKYYILGQDASIFASKSEYITSIATLNLTNPTDAIAASLDASDVKMNPQYLSLPLSQFLFALKNTSFSSTVTDDEKKIVANAKNMFDAFARVVLYPDASGKNTNAIYRIGTFMPYLISHNRERFYEDSLIMNFDTYFYDKNPATTIDRMRTIGLKYMLLDLNAATIDQDVRHALTTRFEHLLTTTISDELRLVDTDSLCLRFALDMWHNQTITTPDQFLSIAGVNYESYTMSGGVEHQIRRGQKAQNCANAFLQNINTDKDFDTHYPYMANIHQALVATVGQADQDKKILQILAETIGQSSYFALFEIQDPENIVKNPETENTENSANSLQDAENPPENTEIDS